MHQILFTIFYALASATGPLFRPCPSDCTCITRGDSVAFYYRAKDGSDELRNKFEAMIRGFYPDFYDYSRAGAAIRASCPFRCCRGHPSKTSLLDMFDNVDRFGSLNHAKYQIPDALTADAQSKHFLHSIPTMLQLSKKYRNSMWIEESNLEKYNAFSETAFYRWAKDIPIFEDPIMREWYIDADNNIINVLIADARKNIFALIAPTVATEFPPRLLAILSACRSLGMVSRFTKYQTSKLIRFGLIAMDTASRDRQQTYSLTNAMLKEFMEYMNWLNKSRKCWGLTPIIQYTRDHPAAVAFQTLLPERLNAYRAGMNLPLIHWDNFGVTKEHIESIAAMLLQPGDGRNVGILREAVFREFVQLSNTSSDNHIYQLGSGVIFFLLPALLRVIADPDLFSAFVAITTKVDMARLAFEARTEVGYFAMQDIFLTLSSNIWNEIENEYTASMYNWFSAAFGVQ